MLKQMLNIYNLKKYPIRLSLPKGVDTASIEQPLSKSKSGTLFMEIWKDIKGYKGHYQISNKGRLKSLDRIGIGDGSGHGSGSGPRKLRGSIMKQTMNVGGYMSIHLSLKGRRQQFLVHRLVASTFIRNRKNKPCVNHLDGIKHNNVSTNLNWVTHSENTRHAIRTGLKVAKCKPIAKYCMYTGEKLGEYQSLKAAAKAHGVQYNAISAHLGGCSRSSAGFVWKFI